MISHEQILGLSHVIKMAKTIQKLHYENNEPQSALLEDCKKQSTQLITYAEELRDQLSATCGTDYFPSFPSTFKPAHEQVVLLYTPDLAHNYVLAKYIQDKSRACADYHFEGDSVWDEATQKYYWPEGFYSFTHNICDFSWHHLENLTVQCWWTLPGSLIPANFAKPAFFYKGLDEEAFVDIDTLFDQIESDAEVLFINEVQTQLQITMGLPSAFFVKFPSVEDASAHVLKFDDGYTAQESVRQFKLDHAE